MPLSEHEQRLLEQMERALNAEDPKLASALRGATARQHHHRRVALGVAGVVAGLVLLLVGAIAPAIAVGTLGFVLMLAGLVFAVTSWRQLPGADRSALRRGGRPGRRGPGRPKAGAMDRIEDRWRRRREQNGG